MKKVLVLLMALLFMAMAAGCTEGEDEIDIVTIDTDGPEGLGAMSDWNVTAAPDNAYEESNFTITEDDDPLRGAVMKVSWGSSITLKHTDLWAELPEGYDYGEYDGLILDVKVDVHQNMMFALRNLPIYGTGPGLAGTAWKIWEDTVFYTGGWQTLAQPFGDATNETWGPLAAEATLNEWLTGDKAVQKVLSLNLLLNTAATNSGPGAITPPRGNAINSTYYNLYKRIGFYKGDDPHDPDDILWIWVF